MNEKEYRALAQVSQSECKSILQESVRDWHYKKRNRKPATEAMIRGTICHKAIELGHKSVFESEYAVDRWPSETGLKRSQKGYKEYKASLRESGRPYIKEEDIEKIEGMLGSVERDFGMLCKGGNPEYAITGVEMGGVTCKGLIDHLPPKDFIFDYKTTGMKLDDRQLYRFLHYDLWKVQAAFYHDLYKAKYGESRSFVFLIVVDYPPHNTRKMVVEPYSEAMESGRELYLEAIETYKKYNDCEFDDLPKQKIYRASQEGR